MTQLDLFDLLTGNPQLEATSMPFSIETKKINSLKRGINYRVVDPEVIAKKMMDRIGCLYLHAIKPLKPYSTYSEYLAYLTKRVYTTYFADKVLEYHKLENELVLKDLSSLLSDDHVTVELSKLTGIHQGMVEGKALDVRLTSNQDNMSVYLITGTTQITSKRHFQQRYFRRLGQDSTRTIVSIHVLAELLLEKEMRYYYDQASNVESIKEWHLEQFVKDNCVHIPETIIVEHKAIYELLSEYAQDNGYGLRSSQRSSNAPQIASILAYYNRIHPAGLKVTYSPSKGEQSGAYRNTNYGQLMRRFVSNIIPRIHDVLYHVREVVGSSKDYAASYVQKKNIPEKTLNKMANSTLLSFFESVEYDEMVDLSLVDSFEREITDYIKTFKLLVPKQAAFKVRRLGKHRAGGLFFPVFNTLCIDVSHPSSFIHEFWHMIDYYFLDNQEEFDGNRLSNAKDFKSVIAKYKEVVEGSIKALPSDHAIRTRFYGTTKFNKDYYFDSGEIFARAAEIYFREQLNGKSSLVKSEDSYFLPNDAQLNEIIATYFSILLKKGEPDEITAA